MSTSSGRKGSCERCGHFLDGHAHPRDSKCKNCKKIFEICQVATHGGWRICFIPCNCGKNYYPDKARAAVPLASHEYEPDHAAYRALTPDEDEYDTTIEPSSSISHGGGYTGHGRTNSTDSEDPLAWSKERYQRETTGGIDELTGTLRKTHIGERRDWSEWAWDTGRKQWGRYRISGGKYEYEWRDAEPSTSSTSNAKESIPTAWSDWAWDVGRNQWERYRISGGKYEYEWRDAEPSTSSTSNAKESIPTAWSDWAWDVGRNQWGRYRMSRGAYEYEWRDPESSEQGKGKGKESSRKGKGKGRK